MERGRRLGRREEEEDGWPKMNSDSEFYSYLDMLSRLKKQYNPPNSLIFTPKPYPEKQIDVKESSKLLIFTTIITNDAPKPTSYYPMGHTVNPLINRHSG
uniref:Uncharacterized protein n=1 Tax=Oryza glumipatula TaxID=40148 RepID=A0A0D9ZXC3_9ORYZ